MNQTTQQLTYVYLETTNFCNLDCVFCNRRDVVKNPIHMTLENWDIVLNKLSGQPVTEAKLMGLGEPFMHPQFHEVCRRFKATFPKAFVIVATNCQYKLNDNFKKALSYIDLLYLSVDGYQETYEKMRPGAKWNRLIEFFDTLLTIDRGKTRITINFVVTPQNHSDVDKLHALVDVKYPFIEEIRLNIAQWWSEDEECPVTISENDWRFFETLVRYKSNVKGKAPWDYDQCFWPTRGLYMDVKGNVKICCLNTSTEPIGNLLTQPLEEILNDPKRLQVAHECRTNNPGKHCRTCDYKRLSPVLEKIFKGEIKSHAQV